MKKVLVWDWPVRVMHWLMVILFTGLILTGRADEDYWQWHFYMGYSLSAVIIARLLYGFLGSSFARFKQFLYHPMEVLGYVKTLLIGRGKAYLGHNPVGGIMVLVLLLALSLQWLSGLFTSDDIFWFGPLYGALGEAFNSQMSSLHHLLPDILLILVALHIVAVLYHELRFKERLVAAMVHGRKVIHGQERDTPEQAIKTPRLGVTVSLMVALAWLAWLWSVPI
ncbi:cytochrome b/b6 domain-containing protein [Marinomonas ostreistagni]|uniref:cytochrome b/b6 domain-containing protein n=1 Tax=Marinomonas ostreistagni TaxID=359209 RepID=UPI00194FE254|nr:cytochrome b/b6 domain-containing protein [Marinomonas ostreistagni]MBM6551544.1 cytochrome b/b6 domain-containing protein [Marinomonas ostreistagni]